MSNATQKNSMAMSAGMSTLPNFTIVERRIVNPHEFQFYFQWGMTQAGPWAKVGLNDTEYIVGFAPAPRRPVRRQQPLRQPNPAGAKNG